MILNIIRFVFAAGWFITAISIFIQLFKIIKTKQTAGVSLWSYAMIGLLNINSVLWLYNFDEYWYWSLPGAVLIVISCFSIVYYVYKYDPEWRPMYRCCIVDWDGTVLKTQNELHAPAEAKVLARYGVVVDPVEISKKYAGHSTRKVFKELAPGCDPDQLVKEKWEIINEYLDHNTPESIEYIVRLIEHLDSIGLPVVVASASPRWYIEKSLNKTIPRQFTKSLNGEVDTFKLKECFGGLYVSAEDVPNPKPAPDVFLAAATLAGINPKDCLVIGDGKSDVLGGIAAGMNVLFLGEEDDEIRNLSKVKAFSNDKALYDYLVEVDFRKTF